MINELIFVFACAFAYVSIFLLHEFFHCLEGLRQGGNNAHIQIWSYHGIPSLMANCLNIKNKDLFNIAGGLYSGIISLAIGAVGWYNQINYLEIPFVSLGILNVIYSFYEYMFLGKWHRDKYMINHYILYEMVLIPLMIYYIVR